MTVYVARSTDPLCVLALEHLASLGAATRVLEDDEPVSEDAISIFPTSGAMPSKFFRLVTPHNTRLGIEIPAWAASASQHVALKASRTGEEPNFKAALCDMHAHLTGWTPPPTDKAKKAPRERRNRTRVGRWIEYD